MYGFLFLLQLLLVLHITATLRGADAVATTIDLTTTYTPISKTTSRYPKAKLLKQSAPSSPSASQPQPHQQKHAADLISSNDDLNLVVAPSKSYISQPTTQSSKLIKRAGQTAELKQKKPLKEIRNRTQETERSSKLQQAEVVSCFNSLF